MDELEYIKKVEDDVIVEIEKARIDAEKRFNKAKSMREAKIQEMIEKANREMNMEIENAKKKAEKEADEILNSIALELNEIEKKGSKNLDNAVRITIDEFLKIK